MCKFQITQKFAEFLPTFFSYAAGKCRQERILQIFGLFQVSTSTLWKMVFKSIKGIRKIVPCIEKRWSAPASSTQIRIRVV